MSIWVKADACQVYMNISGAVCAAHVEFLRNHLLNRLQYGYQKIIVNLNNVSDLDQHGLMMFRYVRDQVDKKGGELIFEDAAGRIAG
ncbi:STAS domain-containing protein|uniref:STAS domain-containing protein n=1 Tax=Dendrosporobacter quercicolus TaxID=146817 RepID=A0A1G9QT81_9FIRM|nr:STAS domain-containing protein [Dendrosporobacter quercicolus]NSL48355.1 STAS domain-containing protein [Dendrosporobacter quercicolus DSM 1736]SDM14228.1 STAS domain-containing protein [Dendrosporobacter quercicolus]